MDALSEIFMLLSAKSYLSTGIRTGGEWSLSIKGYEGLKFCAVLEGQVWFKLKNEGNWRQLKPMDGFILTHKQDFILASDPTRPPIDAEHVLDGPIDGFMHYAQPQGVTILAGKMSVDNAIASMLLDPLPNVMHLQAGAQNAATMQWLLTRLNQESQFKQAGWETVQSYLMHLLFIEGIRYWLFSEENSTTQGWLNALKEPRISRVLGELHRKPERNWTLQQLANIAQMSRTSFAQHFKKITGKTAIDYLTQIRLLLACKKLAYSQDTIAVIADSLGYGSETAFSCAFKRIHGIAPSYYRKKMLTTKH